MFSSIIALSTPEFSRLPRNAVQEGSTPLDVNPDSASYPMCATCLKDPACGPDIMDLSILPPFEIETFLGLLEFFGFAGMRLSFFSVEALLRRRDADVPLASFFIMTFL
jgi:hypothetical protein